LNPLQTDFIENDCIHKERLVVSAPTASGKTLLAVLDILERYNKGDNTFIYLVPYNSIRDQKYKEFLEKFDDLDIIIKKGYEGLKDLQDGNANIVISDFTTFDRYSRENQDYNLASFYIFDEIDVLGSEFFGPSIEGCISRLLRKGKINLLAISATIPESNQLLEWFDAEFFMHNTNPSNLKKM